jgi:hypothetical protein
MQCLMSLLVFISIKQDLKSEGLKVGLLAEEKY